MKKIIFLFETKFIKPNILFIVIEYYVYRIYRNTRSTLLNERAITGSERVEHSGFHKKSK